MKKLLTLTCLVAVYLALSSHDMFLKMNTYFVQPNSEVIIHLYNGTFDQSENVITRDRMLNVSIVSPDGSIANPPKSAWSEEGKITVLKTKTTGEGTYVAGVSTAVKSIELSAEDFNGYLVHDGIMDVLEQRKKTGEDKNPAVEKYSKHVKAIFQAGNATTDSYKKELGYPVEFIPMQNPYSLKVNDQLEVRLLRSGKPAANQLVYASYGGFHSHSDTGGHLVAVKTRTDKNGIAKIPLSKPGHWYVSSIYMEKSSDEGIDYESNWSTLTFELKD
ncbi:MAG: DUF4198 domain-containing protein [Bacteroidetes bacterium]|nr:DUF4198 domain-containing protein [Bacteroidota bacterium]